MAGVILGTEISASLVGGLIAWMGGLWPPLPENFCEMFENHDGFLDRDGLFDMLLFSLLGAPFVKPGRVGIGLGCVPFAFGAESVWSFAS